jgi:hypothetical protein
MSARELEAAEGGPERIYLAPRCCTDPSEGRIWCEHDVWPLDDCPEHASGIEYIRADLARALTEKTP